MLCGSFAERVRSGDISFLRDRPVAQLHEDQIPMAHLPQIRIPATYMRGGTSKGVFFRLP